MTFFSQATSPEVDGKVTVAFLPTMNVVSGLLQDGELTHDQAVKVRSFSFYFIYYTLTDKGRHGKCGIFGQI